MIIEVDTIKVAEQVIEFEKIHDASNYGWTDILNDVLDDMYNLNRRIGLEHEILKTRKGEY